MSGRFITLEGIEGAGKSTVILGLRDALVARGVRVLLTREPGGTPLAERIRQTVLERSSEIVPPVAETLLMFAARSIHLENRILPALAAGDWVLCDRFTDATRAYQGAGRGVNRDWIETLATAVHGNREPDRTLLLDVPVSVGHARLAERHRAPDRIEAERAEFFERVRAGYAALAQRDANRFRVLDASRPLGLVIEDALGAVVDLIEIAGA